MKKNLVFLTAIISGFAIFINKFGVKFTNPDIFTFVKNSVVSVFLLSAIIMLKEAKMFRKLSIKQWSKLLAIGLIGGSIPFLLFFKGLSITSSAKAAFIHKTMFIFVATLSYRFLKERFDWRFFVGALALIAGNFLLLKLSWQPFNIGDLMIFAATLLWAAENTLSKHTLKTVAPKIVAFSRMFFGSLFILVFLIASKNISDLFILTQQQLLWSAVPSLFLFLYVLTWYTGLKYVPATYATAVLLLGSPITTLLNVVFAGAAITVLQVAGIMLLASGITLLLFSIRKIKFKIPQLYF